MRKEKCWVLLSFSCLGFFAVCEGKESGGFGGGVGWGVESNKWKKHLGRNLVIKSTLPLNLSLKEAMQIPPCEGKKRAVQGLGDIGSKQRRFPLQDGGVHLISKDEGKFLRFSIELRSSLTLMNEAIQ